MDWSRWRNPVFNFVNLGRLYSLSQKDKLWLDRSLRVSKGGDLPHGVNLGGLFESIHKSDHGQPLGWAYFEDGSMFVPRWSYTHHELQQVMKIAACFLRNPSDGKRTLKKKDKRQTQMILLEKNSTHTIFGPGYLHMYARYTHTGENVFAPSTLFRPIRLELDPTQTFPITTFLYPRNYPIDPSRASSIPCQQVPESLRTFRGTLIDGVLQPNVRLGNGLDFSVDPSDARDAPPQAAQVAEKKTNPQQREIREQQIAKAFRKPGRQQRISQQKQNTSAKSMAPSDSGQRQKDWQPQYLSATVVDPRVAQFEARERELQQRENSFKPRGDAFRWQQEAHQLELRAALLEKRERELEKREYIFRCEQKAWRLEQELAEVRAKQRSNAYEHAPRNRPAVNASKSKPVDAHQADDISETDTRSQTPPGEIWRGRVRQRGRRELTSSDPSEEKKREREAKEREAKAEAESIFKLLDQDDIMPSNALELLRKVRPKR